LLSETFIEINKDRKKGKDFREKLQRMWENDNGNCSKYPMVKHQGC
jgi:hypothetical protein